MYLEPLGEWQVEHQIPRYSGGGDEIQNLVASCCACNARKGKRDVDEYRRSLQCKLENAITTAYELAGEMESCVAWDSPLEADGGFEPPQWLSEIESLLHEAATRTVRSGFLFFGEVTYPCRVERSPQPEEEAGTIG